MMAEVKGNNPAPSGQSPVDDNGMPVPVGVWGDSSAGVGVFGTSGDPSPNIYIWRGAGVYGQGGHGPFQGEGDYLTAGVFGISPDTGVVGIGVSDAGADGMYAEGSGEGNGLYAVTDSGTGVMGVNQYGENAYGVEGRSFEGTGVLGDGFLGVYGYGGVGVRGESPGSGNGTEGNTYGSGTGVVGRSFFGSSDPGPAGTDRGVSGSSFYGDGVYGVSIVGSGVYGYKVGENPHSDYFEAAVVGENDGGGLAGLFLGRVGVIGPLFKSGGGFRVDHPLDPHNKYLSHSFVESPDMLNVYSGTVLTDDEGNARVALPDYFEALNDEFRYQLTTVGQFAQLTVSEEISQNSFGIRSDVPHVKVCWQVTGVRRDAWAQANRIPVEEDKSNNEKGHFLHPELFGGERDGRRTTQHRIEELAASFPDHLRDRATQVLSEVAATGSVDNTDLSNLLAEVGEAKAQAARERRENEEERLRRSAKIADRLRPPPLPHSGDSAGGH
jgi:hypothetical protein